jgi:hypothetical protein
MDLVVIVEGPEDARTACTLADRIVVEEGPHWLDQHTRDAMRTWTGLQPGEEFTTWTDVKRLAKKRSVRHLGFPASGDPEGADFAQAWKAITLHSLIIEEGDNPALLLVRDTDAERESRRDLDQARQQPTSPDELTVVVGVARPKREAWVLNGFDPEDENEEERLADLKQELGCDPRTDAHTLTASSSGAKTNAKRVLGVLVDSVEREQRCCTETELDTLRDRGGETGLAAYLEEVEARLLPLFQERPE